MAVRLSFMAATAALAAVLSSAAPLSEAAAADADADICGAVENAVRAIGKADRFHSRLVARTPGRRRPAEEEQFVLGDVVYASSPASGRWVKLPLSAAGRNALSAGIAAHPPRDCRDDGTAELGGAAMRVYAYSQDLPNREGAPSVAHGRLWVAAADGRPHRYEGQHGEVRVVLTLDYDAVTPPFGK